MHLIIASLVQHEQYKKIIKNNKKKDIPAAKKYAYKYGVIAMFITKFLLPKPILDNYTKWNRLKKSSL